MTRKGSFAKWRRKRRAVSPVIAELLLIVITVAIGTLVYSFASTAFGGFGSGFSNLVQNAGQQLSENVVVEQAYFYNSVSNNSVSCVSGDAVPNHCGGVLYVRNVGVNPVLINQVYLGNVTSPTSPPILTVPSSTTPTCSSSTLTPAKLPNTAGQVCFFTFNPAPLYPNNLLPMTTADEIQPGQVAVIHFMLPDSSFCPGNPNDSTVAYGGTTYAFTLVTSRGNEFVAYETA